MLLTFGQYNTLMTARQPVTHDEVVAQLSFDRTMVSYYVTGLLSSGMITVGANRTYRLTEAGELCLEEYERYNPELNLKRAFC